MFSPLMGKSDRVRIGAMSSKSSSPVRWKAHHAKTIPASASWMPFRSLGWRASTRQTRREMAITKPCAVQGKLFHGLDNSHPWTNKQ